MAGFILIVTIVLAILNCSSPSPNQAHPPTPTQIEYLSINDLTHRTYRRDKRSTISSSHVIDHEVKFTALGRTFHMFLHERDTIVAPNFKVSVIAANGSQKVFDHNLLNKFYHGHLAGHPDAKVSATIDSSTGSMTGYIDDVTSDLLYFIEPAKNLNASDSTGDSMVIYTYDKVDQANQAAKFCDAINFKDDPQFSTGHKRFTRYANIDESASLVPENLILQRPNRCGIRLVADTSFFRQMGYNVKSTVSYVISVMDRINAIYTGTNFGDDLKGFGFLVQEVQVLSEFSNDPNHFNSRKEGREVTINLLLDQFSNDKSHKWFCLSHLFTHTRFKEGVLGLAYVANPRKAVPGGICSGKVIRNAKEYYYNTGVTSTKNSFGVAIFTRITDLITAHELGHNWGAEHDPDLKECSPSSFEGGPYLMHTYSLNGYESNNKLFSPCSKRAIANVLSYRSPSCFIAEAKSVCGNGILEGNEECDAAHLSDGITPDSNRTDPCCTIECKFKPGVRCSDLNHLCCENCQPRPAGSLCREANSDTCRGAVHCDGRAINCPTIANPISGTKCLDDGICSNGVCQSPCEREGKIPCICHEKEEQFCLRCCRSPGPNTTCSPLNSYVKLSDGSPCFYGFCINGRCKRAPQDTVKRLWDMVRSSSLNAFLKIMFDNLVVVTLFILACIYIPLSIWINSKDRKLVRKLTQNRRKYYSGSGDSHEMQRLNPRSSAPSLHTYNLRSNHRHCDVPDEVDSNQRSEKVDTLESTD